MRKVGSRRRRTALVAFQRSFFLACRRLNRIFNCFFSEQRIEINESRKKYLARDIEIFDRTAIWIDKLTQQLIHLSIGDFLYLKTQQLIRKLLCWNEIAWQQKRSVEFELTKNENNLNVSSFFKKNDNKNDRYRGHWSSPRWVHRDQRRTTSTNCHHAMQTTVAIQSRQTQLATPTWNINL